MDFSARPKRKEQSTHLVPSQVARPTSKDEHEPNNGRQSSVECRRAGHGGEEAAGPAPALPTSPSPFVGLLLGMGRLGLGGVGKLAWAGYAWRGCGRGVRPESVRWLSSSRREDHQRGCASDDRARRQEPPQERTTDGVHVYASSTGPKVRERRVDGALCWKISGRQGVRERRPRATRRLPQNLDPETENQISLLLPLLRHGRVYDDSHLRNELPSGCVLSQPAFAVSRMLGTDAAVTWSTTLPP